MNPSRQVNEFLPAGTPDRMDIGHGQDDEFTLAQYKALRKDKLEELKRLDDEHRQMQTQIERHLQEENQHLLSQVQHKVHESIQQVFVDLQQSIAATVAAQVDLRLQQQRLRKEYAESTASIEQRHLNKFTQLIGSSATRAAMTHGYDGRESVTPGSFSIPLVNSRNQASPAAQSEPLRASIPSMTPVPQEKPAEQRMSAETMSRPPPMAKQQTPESLPQHNVSQPQTHQQQLAPQQPITKQRVSQQPITQQPLSAEAVASEPPPAQREAETPKLHDARSHGETQTASGAKHGQAKRVSKDLKDEKSPDATPRQDTKRKASNSPATSIATTPKRQRTRDKTQQQEAFEDAAETPVDQNHNARGPSETLEISDTPVVQRTIPFDEVYQDGKAQYKHQIFEYKVGSGNWYIVKCDEHDVHFKYGNPVHGAAKHVASPQHGNRNKKHDLAIQLCGYLVTGCNAELAELNNREFKRAIDEDGYEVHNRNLLSKSGRQRADERKKQPNSGKEGGEIHVNGENSSKKHRKQGSKSLASGTIIKPKPKPKECHFYLGYWSSTKKFYCLIVLPIRPDGNLREVGLREKFQEMPLIDNAPKCYRVDRVSLQIKGWQPAYEDGGPKVDKREYPVMYFDKNPPSLGWLSGQKLEPLDLDNPPVDIVDIKGLKKARQWYAEKMNHRKSWDEFKALGPGEPPSATPNGEGGWDDQGSFLRSAYRQDEDSPRRSRLRGGESAEIDDSSSSDSDDEDPMKMDIGPIPDPEAGDSNYVDGSGSDGEGSVIETKETEAQQNDNDKDKEARRTSGSGRDQNVDQDTAMDLDEPVESQPEVDSTASKQDKPPRGLSRQSSHDSPRVEQPDRTNNHVQGSGLTTVLSEQERIRKNAQAKAAEAIRDAASRSRTSSEVPAAEDALKAPAEQDVAAFHQHQTSERPDNHARPNNQARPDNQVQPDTQARAEYHAAGFQARAGHQAREGLWDHQRSRSDDVSSTKTVLAAPNMGKLNEGRKNSNIESILNPASNSKRTDTNENGFDSYKRFDDLKRQMQSDPARSASVPIPPNTQPFQPPPVHQSQPRDMQARHSGVLSPPPLQPLMMGPPSSASPTPVPGSRRSTPGVMMPATSERWQAVRTSSFGAVPQTPQASFVNTAAPVPGHGSGPVNGNDTPHPAQPQPAMSTPVSTTRAETPNSVADKSKKEVFDVYLFHDMGRRVRWSRDNPKAGYLRLVTDPIQGVALSTGLEGFTAVIDPGKVSRIEVDTHREEQRVQLMLKDGSEQMVMFETNSASGRMLNAKIQARRFVGWVRKCNPDVEFTEWTRPPSAK
ncbi:hypothetical protein VP1G_01057 [Cytospora mali]|uniref:Uncharacterized protein n=1 Tax=Cytospora mali TaxID=578113 RepID=A0A194UPB4_CYTMA|nr:hypothetical protein VP1G_01057 [Valsa mali var. pyri (nom. inval.)]